MPLISTCSVAGVLGVILGHQTTERLVAVQAPTKKLGEMLVEAGLISTAQLSETLRHQRFHGGRMGSNLVSLGFITEEVLMDFLAQQTGVPRLDPKVLENIEPSVLKRIPQRMAEQLTILPIAYKEPRSLVLAMADPSDLNAIDSARFASGLGIEPLVASHTMLRAAIVECYRSAEPKPVTTFEVGRSFSSEDALPVSFDMNAMAAIMPSREAARLTTAPFGKDPFFDDKPEERHVTGQFGTVFEPPPFETPDPFDPFAFPSPEDIADITAVPVRANPGDTTVPLADGTVLIHSRGVTSPVIKRAEAFGTRNLVLGLIKVLQRRGTIGEDEVQRTITALIESGELKAD